jgi:prepilin-type N-terminal cleavage/methylation domain-containing protein
VNRRGTTLIELMVCVAVLGITAAAAGVTGSRMQAQGRAAIQQEQALLLLEYHASCASTGAAVDDAVADRLMEPLPDGTLWAVHGGKTTTLEVSWRDAMGRPTARRLTVFDRGGGR